jgi:hypothetical protein
MRLGFALMMSAVIGSGLMSACSSVGDGATTPTSVEAGSSSSQVDRQPVPPSERPSPPVLDTCDRDKAQWTIGEKASASLLERARVAAEAGSARFLRPNQPITMEYLGSRLNLNLDARDIVRSVVCG